MGHAEATQTADVAREGVVSPRRMMYLRPVEGSRWSFQKVTGGQEGGAGRE